MSSGTLSPFSFSSAMEPMDIFSPQSGQVQMLSGVPQYLFLESAQSWTFSSQSPKRLSPRDFGIQLIFLLFAMRRSRTAVILMNQDSLA